MGRVSLTAVVLWSLASFAGCASIAGLDGITTDEKCAPNCGTDSGTTGDSTMQPESGGDSGPQPDTFMGADTFVAVDSSSGGDTEFLDTGVQDTFVQDTFVWDGPPFDDAAFDSGCGSLNTTSNCGACGNTCAAAVGTQTISECCSAGFCPGSTNGSNDICKYTCANGHKDCNASVPPNGDGCECAAPATASCCGLGCPTQHTDGLIGQAWYPADPHFYDCVPTGTMNSQLAQDACNDYVLARGGAANYCQPFSDSMDASSPDSWCSAACVAGTCTGFMSDCICWSFSGTYVGTVLDPQAQGISMPQNCYYGTSSVTFN